MRKFMLLIFASMFLFACSQDEQTIDVPESEGLTFKVVIQNEPTRAGASIYSEEATHSVNDLKVYVFDTAEKYVGMFDLSSNPGLTTGWTTVTEAVADQDELPDGTYTAFAVGRTAGDTYELPALVVGTTTMAQMIATIDASGNESDIYAGKTTESVTAGAGAVTINIARKVSGFLGYFTNVPTTIGSTTVATLRLSVGAANQGVDLNNTTKSTGVTPVAGYNLINIDLTGQTVSNGVYIGNAASLPSNVVTLENAQLAGGFMIPTTGTLTLGLYDAGNNPLKTWTITDAGYSTINFLAGELYSLGKKGVADTTNGTNGTDESGGGDDDKAIDIQDLLGAEGITVNIDGSWGPIHALQLQ